MAVLFLFSLRPLWIKCSYTVQQFLPEIGSVLRITDTPAAVSSLSVGIMINSGERKLANLLE